MAVIQDPSTGNSAGVDTNGTFKTGLYDSAGNPILKIRNQTFASATDRGMPMAGINDGQFRFVRITRSGSMASAKYTPWSSFQLEAAALPSNYLSANVTMTTTYALTTGALLNAAATGAINTYAGIFSMRAAPKWQKSPMLCRSRIRLIPGGTNGTAEIGLSSVNNLTTALSPNGFTFLYGTDGTLKPTVYLNSTVVSQGADILPTLNTAGINKYFVWDILVDDDSVTFFVQDPVTGLILVEQSFQTNALDTKLTASTHYFPYARVYVAGTANVGAATQIYLSDQQVLLLDTDATRDWTFTAANLGNSNLISPVVNLTQLANYANSAAPTSATLSNTAAGYSTPDGQFQFAAVAGAETDFVLFGYQSPAPYSMLIHGIAIDTVNTGAAVATTATTLQWGISANSLAVTAASNTFRKVLGMQTFAVAAAIGAQASRIDTKFRSPLSVESGRWLQVLLKIPIGTATASQIIRGTVTLDYTFE